MGYFKDLEIDIIEMYRKDGMKEHEIAKSLGTTITQVHEIISAYERREMDYDESDTDAEMVSYDDLVFEPSEPEDF